MIKAIVLYAFSIILTGCGGQQMIKDSEGTSSKVKDTAITTEMQAPNVPKADSTSNNQITMTISPNIFKLPKINKANLNIINNSNYQLIFGSHYSIEYFTGENWDKVEFKNAGFTDGAYGVAPGKTKDMGVLLQPVPYDYKPGKYRISKIMEEVRDSEKKYIVTAYFEIQ